MTAPAAIRCWPECSASFAATGGWQAQPFDQNHPPQEAPDDRPHLRHQGHRHPRAGHPANGLAHGQTPLLAGAGGERCEHPNHPKKPIELGALATHHILDEELADCPPASGFSLPPGTEYLIGHDVDYDWQV